jgi:hypothetical protein
MLKKFYLVVPALIGLFSICYDLPAQKPAKNVLPAAANYKRPIVKSWLGKVSGTISMTADEARQLVALPLKISDDKNLAYALSSYQFAYKRVGVTEDEETGKTSPQSNVTADRFTTTPLPPVWQKNIVEGLHSGEELYFFDIIVFDKQGRRFFAPELRISIQ